MTTVQKFLMGALGLGALYLVFSNPQGVAAAGKAGQQLVGGTIAQIATGGKSK